MSGWIKLHRSIKDWEWYDDINATRLLIHFLVSVNYEDKKWKGIEIKAGSLVYSWESLSKDCGLSVQQCRTSINKLKSSGEVTIKSTNKYQVLTLVKWDKLQDLKTINNNQNNNQITNNQQSNNKQVTTTKEYNNIRKEEYNNNNEKLDVEDINEIYYKFIDEFESGNHNQAIEQMYMRLKIKKGSLTPLLVEFKGQLIIDNVVHKNTLEFRKHFNNWLNVQDREGKLKQYKKIKSL